MDIKELRIGNLVSSNDPKLGELRVSELSDDHAASYGVLAWSVSLPAYGKSDEQLSPIPLTKEWLLKFGFERVDHLNGYSFYSLKRKRNELYEPSICIYKARTTVGNDSTVKHCESVHQLQNLYFVLTGKEISYEKTN